MDRVGLLRDRAERLVAPKSEDLRSLRDGVTKIVQEVLESETIVYIGGAYPTFSQGWHSEHEQPVTVGVLTSLVDDLKDSEKKAEKRAATLRAIVDAYTAGASASDLAAIARGGL